MNWKMKMNNYEEFLKLIEEFFDNKGIEKLSLETNLRDASLNEDKKNPTYVYNYKNDLRVISMDCISQKGYRSVYGITDIKRSLNTVDAFLIDYNNDWYFVEFKDCKLSSKKDNIEKKGMANWLMLLSILYDLGSEKCKKIIDLENPIQFAKDHLIYIVVCSATKDPYTYGQVKNYDLLGQVYTPPCLYRFKDYLFKNAFAFTDVYFEQRFVKTFRYE